MAKPILFTLETGRLSYRGYIIQQSLMLTRTGQLSTYHFRHLSVRRRLCPILIIHQAPRQ